MANVKSELKTIFESEGFLDSENLVLENLEEDVKIDLAKILKKADGKQTKIVVTTTENVEVPTIESEE